MNRLWAYRNPHDTWQSDMTEQRVEVLGWHETAATVIGLEAGPLPTTEPSLVKSRDLRLIGGEGFDFDAPVMVR